MAQFFKPEKPKMQDVNVRELPGAHALVLLREASDLHRQSRLNATTSSVESNPASKKHAFLADFESSVGGVFGIVSDVARGAAKELITHPVELLKDVAVGVAAVAVGPESVLIGGAAAVIGVGVAEIYKHGGFSSAAEAGLIETKRASYGLLNVTRSLVHEVIVDFDPSKYSKNEQAKAKAGVENLGAFGAQLTAGALGGGFARILEGALSKNTLAFSTAEAESIDGTATLALKQTSEKNLESELESSVKPVFELTDPAEIDKWVASYADRYGRQLATHNVGVALRREWVVEGTENFWKSAIG